MPKGEKGDSEEGEDGEEDIDKLIKAAKEFFAAYRGDIGKIIQAFAASIRHGSYFKFAGTAISFGLLAFIILIVRDLGMSHVISGDSVTFMYGAVLGYLFTFLKKYIGIATG